MELLIDSVPASNNIQWPEDTIEWQQETNVKADTYLANWTSIASLQDIKYVPRYSNCLRYASAPRLDHIQQ